MRTLCLLALAALLLSGCGEPMLSQADRQATAHPREALSAASRHRRQGDWAAAVKILREAQKRYPDNPRIADALHGLEAAWAQEKQSVRDRILLQQAQSLSRQLPLREALVRLDPEDLAAHTALLALRLRLKDALQTLDTCAANPGQTLTLRRRCAQLALEITPDPARRQRFADLDQRYQARVAGWRKRLAQEAAQKAARHRRALLRQARALVKAGRYHEARPLLEQVLAAEPDNRAGTGLMIQLQTSLEAQVKALLQLGDTLYREGKLRAAIAAWRTVLSLSPEHPEAGAKIQRARHVLEKLERLRQRQGGTGGLSPRSGT